VKAVSLRRTASNAAAAGTASFAALAAWFTSAAAAD
jgi:hypothetical protein